jgi:hypothetical protein
MRSGIDFLLGLLAAADPVGVAWEDFAGIHGRLLELCQELGFVGRDPGANPVPTCPDCDDGVPYRLGDRLLCAGCRSTIDPRALLLWPFDRVAFLRWLAEALGLGGGVRRIDDTLWQLGTGESAGSVFEGFYARGTSLSEAGQERITAYRTTVLFHGPWKPALTERADCVCVSLLGLLRLGDTLEVAEPPAYFRTLAVVRFDLGSGTLWLGGVRLGEVPVGSKECAFLAALAAHPDRFVPYADLKRFIRQQTGSTDTADDASFCHALKRRIKKRYIPAIDRFLTTSNKADGYRLRASTEP